MKHPSAKNRRGVSLIEVTVAVAVSAVVMTLAVVMLHRLLIAGSRGREHLQQTMSVGRLAEQFRADARFARSVAPAAAEDQPGVLTLRLDGGRQIRYQVDEGALSRTASGGEKPEQREIFYLSNMKVVGIEPRLDEQPARAAIVLARLDPGGDTGEEISGPRLVIEAALGRDHRFTHSERGR